MTIGNVSAKGLYNGCLAGKVLSPYGYGRPPTTISLRESKATSEGWKKNVAPYKKFYMGEDIVYAYVKA